ncbi:hypothetical protein [Streptomyces sp. NPDC001089]
MSTQISEAPAILRGMLRDIVACSDYAEVCQMLGMVPAGPEVDWMEHQQSHTRTQQLNRVVDEVFAHADIAADLLHQLVRLNRCDCDDEDGTEQAMFTVISRTAAATVLGYLIENGTLEVTQ